MNLAINMVRVQTKGKRGRTFVVPILHDTYLVPSLSVTIEEANFLVLFTAHVVQTLSGFNVSNLQVQDKGQRLKVMKQTNKIQQIKMYASEM